MSRSLKKGPFVEEKLFNRIVAMNESNNKQIIKTWSRASTIYPEFVGHTIAVHNGKQHVSVFDHTVFTVDDPCVTYQCLHGNIPPSIFSHRTTLSALMIFDAFWAIFVISYLINCKIKKDPVHVPVLGV